MDPESAGKTLSVKLAVVLVFLAMGVLAALGLWVVVAGARGKIELERHPDGTVGMSSAMKTTGLITLGTGTVVAGVGVYLLATGETTGFLLLGLAAAGGLLVVLAWRFGPYGRRP